MFLRCHKNHFRNLKSLVMLAGMGFSVTPTTLAVQTDPTTSTVPATQADLSRKPDQPRSPQFLRIVEEKNKTIALEIAARDFVPGDGVGPTIALVGVAHIGDRSFYRHVQKLLDGYDVVLYESVKPPGTGGAGGQTDQERIESTQAAMKFVGGMIETQHAKTKQYPVDLEALSRFAASHDPRLVKFLETALVDGWGRSLVYQLQTEQAIAMSTVDDEVTPPYSLVSLGADGLSGGDEAARDLSLADHPMPEPMTLSSEDGLQTQLADALGLAFQLDALTYDKPNWRCSDMAVDEVSRRLAAKGLDFDAFGGTLAGSSLPGKVIKVLLGVMKMCDAMLDGAITDMFKILMIELLSDEKLIEQSLDQLGKGFGEVIVDDRNQVAIDDLKTLIQSEPQVKSVAVLYGAAHMHDMTVRLTEQLGYEPRADSDRWLTAIKVDLTQSAVSASDLRQIRLMIKHAMRQQLRAR